MRADPDAYRRPRVGTEGHGRPERRSGLKISAIENKRDEAPETTDPDRPGPKIGKIENEREEAGADRDPGGEAEGHGLRMAKLRAEAGRLEAEAELRRAAAARARAERTRRREERHRPGAATRGDSSRPATRWPGPSTRRGETEAGAAVPDGGPSAGAGGRFPPGSHRVPSERRPIDRPTRSTGGADRSPRSSRHPLHEPGPGRHWSTPSRPRKGETEMEADSYEDEGLNRDYGSERGYGHTALSSRFEMEHAEPTQDSVLAEIERSREEAARSRAAVDGRGDARLRARRFGPDRCSTPDRIVRRSRGDPISQYGSESALGLSRTCPPPTPASSRGESATPHTCPLSIPRVDTVAY